MGLNILPAAAGAGSITDCAGSMEGWIQRAILLCNASHRRQCFSNTNFLSNSVRARTIA